MELEGEILGFVLIFVAIGAGFFFFLYDHGDNGGIIEDPVPSVTPDEPSGGNQTGNETGGNETEENETVDGDYFYNVEELHWEHMPLTYKFVNNETPCAEGAAIVKMLEAFEILEEVTGGLVYFEETEGNVSDINITCIDRDELMEEVWNKTTCEDVVLDYRTLQFSGYEILEDDEYLYSNTLMSRNDTDDLYNLCYIDTSKVSVSSGWGVLGEARSEVSGNILSGGDKTVYTIDSERPYCTSFPAKEMHDVLHLFGFDHSETPVFDSYYGWFHKDIRYFKDIMFIHTYCPYKTEINSNYIDCLEYIYSNGVQGSGCAVEFIDG